MSKRIKEKKTVRRLRGNVTNARIERMNKERQKNIARAPQLFSAKIMKENIYILLTFDIKFNNVQL